VSALEMIAALGVVVVAYVVTWSVWARGRD
jgi:hypothetical protein